MGAKAAVKQLKQWGLTMIPTANTHHGGYPPHTPYFSVLDNGAFPDWSNWVSTEALRQVKLGLRETAEYTLWRVAKTITRRVSTQKRTKICWTRLHGVLKKYHEGKGFLISKPAM